MVGVGVQCVKCVRKMVAYGWVYCGVCGNG
jgi:hypothetical protein